MSVTRPPGEFGGRRLLRDAPTRPGPRAPTPHPLIHRGLGSNLGGGVVPRGVSPRSNAATHGSGSLTPARQGSPVSTSTPAAPRGVSSASAAATRGSRSRTPTRQASAITIPTPAAPDTPVHILGTAPIPRDSPSPPPDLVIGSSNHARELLRARGDSRPVVRPTSGQMSRMEQV